MFNRLANSLFFPLLMRLKRRIDYFSERLSIEASIVLLVGIYKHLDLIARMNKLTKEKKKTILIRNLYEISFIKFYFRKYLKLLFFIREARS